MIRSKLQKILQQSLEKLSEAVPNTSSALVSEPATGIAADLSSNAALALAAKMHRKPQELAREIAKNLEVGPLLQSVDLTPNGYINFRFSNAFLCGIVQDIVSGKKDWFFPDTGKKFPKTLIEFVSANPTGPLHIGHGRGAALGDSLYRIYHYCGVDVQTEYYINDVGVQMQMLSESVRARSKELEGAPPEPFLENGYKGDYIKDIARLMKDQNRQDFEIFPRTYILDWIKKDLAAFNVHFDSWYSEETLVKENRLQKTLDVLREKNYLKEKDGALWFVVSEKLLDNEEEKSETENQDRVLRKSDGRTTYFASDIAYHQVKFERNYRRCIDIWGHDHHGYVMRMQSSMAALGLPENFLQILLYQLVSLKRNGKKVAMSTRSGEFVTLKEILDEVGKDACRFFFAMRSPNSQLEFDVDLAKSQSNENPVFYVQYVHARICSIFKEAEKRGVAVNLNFAEVPEICEQERQLILKIASLGDILEGCIQISSPHLVAGFLMEVAARFHKFYDSCRVLDADEKTRAFRFALLDSTRKAVCLGLNLLGVSAPEKM